MTIKIGWVGVIALMGWTVWATTTGWENSGTGQQGLPPQKVIWTGDFAQVKSDLREGAEGRVEVCEWNGRPALKITKTNDKGLIVVTAPPFTVPSGAKLRTYANCACSDADPTMAEGYLRLYGKKEDLSYFKGLDGRGPGGPRMQRMVNANPGGAVRKLAHRLADKATGTSITAAIVVSGTPSTSYWTDWGVEDKNVSDKAWSKYRKSLEPADVTFGMIPEAEFDARLSADRDHTARIEKREGFARLIIDGQEAAPVIFRGQTQKDGKITYAGGLHDREGVHLQSTSVRFGRTAKNPLGIWTKDGFDAKAGAALVKTTMRLAPESQMILAVNVSAYPEWCAQHHGEEWMLADGRKVYGSNVHADFHQTGTPPEGKWYWPSYHSRVWREEVKTHLTAFIDELKRQGLSKRIVGVHLSGYHDAQFATRHPDFSPAAVAAFRAWQEKIYGAVKWTEAPTFGTALRLDPVKDAHQAAYLRFVKQGPFHMQEDLARHIKQCFGKDIVVGRYCMGWGAAAFNSALDLWPFVNSDAVDFLVAQPNYANRIPGVALGSRIPTGSFHEHGKLFVNEFDLRTYGGVHGSESELRVMGLSQATDFPMWQTVHRKCAGQMIAQRMGWWYLDMSGTWFSPPEIVKDIAAVNRQVLTAEACGKVLNTWRPSVALAVDEDGLLHYNTIGNYYVKDESQVKTQLADLAGAGVPMDLWMVEDFLANPDLVTVPTRAFNYKVVVFAGMYDRDAPRQALIAQLEKRGVKCVFVSAEAPLTPAAFAQIVREAGGYVPTSTGLQVDMSGNFLSVHALRPGKYTFTLPKKCAVYNMKNGRREANGEKLMLDLTVGETCWFTLGPFVEESKDAPPTILRVGADEKGAFIPAAATAADAAILVLHQLEEIRAANPKAKVILQACDAEGRGQGLCRAAGKFARLSYVTWQGPEAMTNRNGKIETEGDPRSDAFYSKNLGKTWWLSRLERNRRQIAASGGKIDLVMMGDSITHFWERKWTNSWEQFTASRQVLNCGYAGDKVEHLLWRAENGELDGYEAKAVSVLIGTNNNTSPTSDPAKVAAGIRKVLDVIRAKQPKAKILLCAIPPRGRGEKDTKHHEARQRNEQTNALIQKFADGQQVVWVDFRSALIDPATGWADAALMPDRIHPSDKGYEIVRAALESAMKGGDQ